MHYLVTPSATIVFSAVFVFCCHSNILLSAKSSKICDQLTNNYHIWPAVWRTFICRFLPASFINTRYSFGTFLSIFWIHHPVSKKRKVKEIRFLNDFQRAVVCSAEIWIQIFKLFARRSWRLSNLTGLVVCVVGFMLLSRFCFGLLKFCLYLAAE